MAIQKILDYFITYSSFWASWILTLAIIMVYGLWLAQRFQIRTDPSVSSGKNDEKPKSSVAFGMPDKLALALFSIFVLAYIYLIFYKSDFAYSDNSQLTFYSLRSRFFGMPIWVASGRFFPLGLQEYNFIGLFSQSPHVYHGFSVLQLSVLIGALFSIFDKFKIWFRCLIISIVMVTPSFVISFFGLIYPERNILFWLAILLFCYQRLLRTHSRFYLAGVWIAAQFALYYKEPIFSILTALAGFRLIFNFLSEKKSNQKLNYFRFFNSHIVDVGLLFLSASFIGLYLAKFLPILDQLEPSREKLSWSSTLMSYLGTNWLIGIFLIVFMLRVIYLCFSKAQSDLMWDALGLGAVLYFLAFIKLGIFSSYYLAPAEFLAILFLGRLIYQVFTNTNQQQRLILLTATALITSVTLSQNLEQSASHILYRKNIIAGKVELGNYLKAYTASEPPGAVSIYFPFPQSGFSLMEFSSFLEYKGLDFADEQPSDSQDKTVFVVESSEAFDGDLCVEYGRPHKCFYAEAPDSDDLIMILPKREQVSPEDVASIEAESTLLFHYTPKLSWLEKGLLLFSRTYDNSGSWLNAYVFQKND